MSIGTCQYIFLFRVLNILLVKSLPVIKYIFFASILISLNRVRSCNSYLGSVSSFFRQRGWKLIVNVRIHVHFYAGFDDVFWSCNAGFCSPTPSVSSPPILPPLAEQKPSLHRQNTLFTKDHSYKSFQPLLNSSTYKYH